jgi:exosortase
LFGFWFYFGSMERYSLVITIAGIGLLVLGWAAFRSVSWVFAFLFLAVPLPNRVHETVLLPLQQVATNVAAFMLEGLGFVVQRSGAVLQVDGGRLVAVTEACNGLRMLTAFVFVAAVVAFVVRRSAWEKAAIVASSIPIAIIVNAVRLVATGWYTRLAEQPEAEGLFHSLVGVAMMPVAVMILMAELGLMACFTGRRLANG